MDDCLRPSRYDRFTFYCGIISSDLCLVIRERMELFRSRGGELKLYLFYLRSYHKKFIVTFYEFDIAYPDSFSRRVTNSHLPIYSYIVHVARIRIAKHDASL